METVNTLVDQISKLTHEERSTNPAKSMLVTSAAISPATTISIWSMTC